MYFRKRNQEQLTMIRVEESRIKSYLSMVRYYLIFLIAYIGINYKLTYLKLKIT